MRSRTLILLAAVATMTACTSSSEQAAEQPPPPTSASAPAQPAREPGPSMATPLVADTVSAPVAVPATDGKTHLAYELRLTNMLPHDVTLTSVTVLDRDVALLTLDAPQLPQWTKIIGNPAPETTIGAAQTAVVWLDVALDKNDAVPQTLTHTVSVTNSAPTPPLFTARQTFDVAPVDVQKRTPVVIDPPLAGPGWLNGDGCCDTSAHRTALNPINGQMWAAERFAIDYVQLRPDGRLTDGPITGLDNFAYFGADIHAVGDGPVVSVRDGLPEQMPGKSPTGLTLGEYGGNHVVQDLGDGNYAFYAHIKTGTVKVKPGDQLSSGQVIGNVGNTGNSDAPHLHFHVMNTPDPLRSDGLPFVFSSFRLDQRMVSADDLDPLFGGDPAAMQPGFTARDETDVMPLELDVMTYGER